jgi:RNA polymerase sigma-70 factor (ECF subfamily)
MRSTLTMDTLATRATIFLRLKSDDTAAREVAWTDFRARYAPIIAGFARKLSVKPQDVDDVIQDVMLGFFAQSPTFVYDPTRGRFRGYLKVCTFRAMRRRFGKSARLNQTPLDEVDPEHVQVEQAWNDVWEEQLLQRALDATRRQYAADGDEDAFRAFELHVIKGMQVLDVAREIGVSESTVYRAKTRVAASMKRRLSDLEDSGG